MKKNVGMALALILGLFCFAACGAGKEPAGKTQEERQEQETGDLPAAEEEKGEIPPEDEEEETEQEAAGGISIGTEESGQEYKAEDGTVILTASYEWPVAVISGNEQAAAAINEYIRSNSPVDEAEMQEWAKEDYAVRGKENWYSYEAEIKYITERADEKIISFNEVFYSYMGGAHPNADSRGLNFSAETGERLTLADVAEEKEAAESAVREFLLVETKKEEYREMLYDDYEESIGDILTEDTWYLGKDGFHIIANEYTIAPHVAGVMDFVIPYEKADFLKEEYKR